MFKYNFSAQVLWHLPRRFAVLLLRGYQHTLSPDHGPLKGLYTYGYCRHEPTCSEYAKAVITKRGLIVGGVMTFGRVLTCNPWRKPGEAKVRKLLENA